jgi:hypothetical protein
MNTIMEDSADYDNISSRLRSFDKYLGLDSKDLDELFIACENDSKDHQSFLVLHDSNVNYLVPKKKADILPEQEQVQMYDGVLERTLQIIQSSVPDYYSKSSTMRHNKKSSKSPLRSSARNKDSSLLNRDQEQDEEGRCISPPQEENCTTKLDAKKQQEDVSKKRRTARTTNKSTSTGSRRTSGSTRSRSPPPPSSESSPESQEQENHKGGVANKRDSGVGNRRRTRSSRGDSLSLSLHSLYGSAPRASRESLLQATSRGRSPSELGQSEHTPSSNASWKQERHTPSSNASWKQERPTTTRTSERQTSMNGRGVASKTSPRHQGRKLSRMIGQNEEESTRGTGSDRRRRSLSRSGSTPKLLEQDKLERRPSCRRLSRTPSASGLVCDGASEEEENTENKDNEIRGTGPSRRRSSRTRKASMVHSTSAGALRRMRSRTPSSSGGQEDADDGNEKSPASKQAEILKKRESFQSFFGARGGGPGLVGGSNKGNRDASRASMGKGKYVSSANATFAPPSTSDRLDEILSGRGIRRETGQRMMQKFKPTRNMSAGILDDVRN